MALFGSYFLAPLLLLAAFFLAADATCPNVSTSVYHWEQHPSGTCFGISNKAVSHSGCDALCSENGRLLASLAILDNEEMNNFAKEHFPVKMIQGYWIGYYRNRDTNTWSWTSSVQSTTYADWLPGQPDGYCGFEDCAIMADSERWDDSDCRAEILCLCQTGQLESAAYRLSVSSREPPGTTAYSSCPNYTPYVLIVVISLFIGVFSMCAMICLEKSAKYKPINYVLNSIGSHHTRLGNPNPKSVLVLQCPSTATDDSTLEIVFKGTGRPLLVNVPSGVESGDYFFAKCFNEDETTSRTSENTELEDLDLDRCCCKYSDPNTAKLLKRADSRIPTGAFDCIRGMGALQVSIGHYFIYFATTAGGEFGGEDAVLMFFIMSGFLMMIGYANKEIKKSDVTCYDLKFAGLFLRNRVARIGPLYWFSLLVYVPVTVMMGKYGSAGKISEYTTVSLVQYIISALFLQAWYPPLASPNGPLWSVSAQFFCYINFPHIVRPMYTVRSNLRFVGEVVLYWSLYVAIWTLTCIFADFDYQVPHFSPLNKLPLFIIGMIFASQAMVNNCVIKSDNYDRNWGIVCNSLTAFLTGYLCLQIVLGFRTYLGGFFSRVIGELFLPIIYSLWLYSLTQSPECWSARVFSMRPWRILGERSFAWYCLHIPVFVYYSWFRKGYKYFVNDMKPALEPWELLILLPILFLVSGHAFRLIENPARNNLSVDRSNASTNTLAIQQSSEEMIELDSSSMNGGVNPLLPDAEIVDPTINRAPRFPPPSSSILSVTGVTGKDPIYSQIGSDEP